MSKLGKCEHDGCNSLDVSVWTIYGYDGDPSFVMCTPHAIEFGFCPSCGAYIGGTEDTFLTGSDICFECYTAEQREYERCFDDYEYPEDEI